MLVAAGTLALGVLGAAGYFGLRFGYEHAGYEVLDEREGFEIRQYAPRIVAEVRVSGEPETASNRGFRILASYIFGDNVAGADIAMTTPVDRRVSEQGSEQKIAMTTPVDRRQSGDEWIITFTMPSEHTMATLPKPKDPRITLRPVPPRRYAASRFAGGTDEQRVARQIAALRASVSAAGLRPAAEETILSRYDPPWTPRFMRRNEVLLELDL